MEDSKYTKKIYVVLLIFVLVLICTVCKVLSSVILPVVITCLLSFALYPPIRKLTDKFHFPWILSVIIVITLVLGFVIILSTLLVKGFSSIINEYPKYESRFVSIYEIFADQFNLPYDVEKGFFNNLWDILQIRQGIQKIAVFLSSGLFSGSKSILLILLLLVFLLIEIGSFKTKMLAYFGTQPQINIVDMSRQIVKDVSHYLSIKFFISLATGILVYLGSLIIGLNFPIIWGFTAFVLNFIPTFGSIFSSVITTLFALLQFYPSYGKVIFVLVYMIFVNMTLGNVIEPRIEGKRLGLSPFAILVSLSFFGWMWGFIGMIIAVPLTVLIKITCENVPELQLIAVLLGNHPKINKETSDSSKKAKNKIK